MGWFARTLRIGSWFGNLAGPDRSNRERGGGSRAFQSSQHCLDVDLDLRFRMMAFPPFLKDDSS